MKLAAVLLAGGKGKRMHSVLPKVLHQVSGKPLIFYSLRLLSSLPVGKIIIVVGYRKNVVKNAVLKEVSKVVKKKLNFVVQKKQLGTGNAVSVALGDVGREIRDILVLNGDDSFLYKPETIKRVLALHKKSGAVMTFITLVIDKPSGGRIVRDKQGKVIRIVEEKAATNEQLKIREINDGCYIFDAGWLRRNITNIKLNPVGEYYLTDLVEIGAKNGAKIETYVLSDTNEWFGVNTREQLAQANQIMLKSVNDGSRSGSG